MKDGLKESTAILKALDKKAPMHGFSLVEYEVFGLVATVLTTRICDDATKTLILDMRIVPTGETAVFSVRVLNPNAIIDIDKVKEYKKTCDVHVIPPIFGDTGLMFQGYTATLMGDKVWDVIQAQLSVVFDCVCI